MPDQRGHHGHPETITGPARGGDGGHHGHPYEVWDVFTDTPLEGNPLGVFGVAEEIPSRLYPRVARELNLSETVFILPDDPAEADAQIRIFTPAVELPFAGHPTLGAAYALSHQHGYGRVRLRTGAGIVTVTMTRDEHGEIIEGEMAQPIPTISEHPDPEAILAALGVSQVELPITQYVNGPSHVVVTVADAATLSGLSPDFGALTGLGRHGFAVIAELGEEQVATRNFCPALGVTEDPATGSAAGPIAVHLLRHGRAVSGRRLRISQGAEIGRPSTLYATATGTPEAIEAVQVAGSAVRVASGHYRLG